MADSKNTETVAFMVTEDQKLFLMLFCEKHNLTISKAFRGIVDKLMEVDSKGDPRKGSPDVERLLFDSRDRSLYLVKED
mgnify:CR=1 FL=1